MAERYWNVKAEKLWKEYKENIENSRGVEQKDAPIYMANGSKKTKKRNQDEKTGCELSIPVYAMDEYRWPKVCLTEEIRAIKTENPGIWSSDLAKALKWETANARPIGNKQ